MAEYHNKQRQTAAGFRSGRGSAVSVDESDSGVFILMPKWKRKELFIQEKREKYGGMKPPSVQTFNAMHSKTNQLFERIFKCFDLKPEVVKNAIAYAKTLPKPGSFIIDRNIFDAQMKRHFNLTDRVLLVRMYDVCCMEEINCQVTIDDYIELICIFLTNIKDLKVQFVFRVYNWRGDGYLSRKDLEYFIRPMVAQVSSIDEGEEDVTWKFFVDILVNICDQNQDDQVELDEFRLLVEGNVLMMECLGPCLPNVAERYAFLNILSDKSPIECSALFRFERRVSLSQPNLTTITGIQRFYPIHLELP